MFVYFVNFLVVLFLLILSIRLITLDNKLTEKKEKKNVERKLARRIVLILIEFKMKRRNNISSGKTAAL